MELKDLEQIVYSDSKWIEFILNQIIVNAIKYSKGNNDKIEIERIKEVLMMKILLKNISRALRSGAVPSGGSAGVSV